MKKINNFYNNRLVLKPWGYEYVVFSKKKNICITLLKINYNKTTSLHCHPKKKSGFILLKGKALFQLGLWKKKAEIHTSPSKRVIARGLFHSIKSLSKDGLLALEFETPYDKNDLVRFRDTYGRKGKSYEGKKYTKKIDKNFIKFKKPMIGQTQFFKFGKTSLTLETHRNFKKINKNKPNTIFGIIDGSITDAKGRKVLSVGDVVKTNDMKVLSKVFKIKNKLSVAKVI